LLKSKTEPEVDDKPELWPEVVESVSQQEETFSQLMEVEERPVDTLIDLLAEPTLKLVSPLAALRVSFFLRSPDVYDSL